MFRRFLVLILALAMLCAVVSGEALITANASAELMIGDIDEDGEVTVSDSLFALRMTAGIDEYSASQIPMIDTSGDSEVGIDDALGILRCSVGLRRLFGYSGIGLTLAPNATAVTNGITQEIFDRSIVSEGNTGRLAAAMQKASRGERITVAVLGGSITAGSSASASNLCYGYLVGQWWRNKFPQTSVSFHNMGIGATGSMIGVHRLADDILSKNPDFVVVEFAVNDGESDTESYECIIRRIYENSPNTAVIMLFMTDQSGWNVQAQEIPVGREYGIPMISYRDAVWPELAAGRLVWTDISPDNIHPNDRGHAIVASLITSYLDGVYVNHERRSNVVPAIPDAVIGDKYMNAKLYMGGTYTPDSLGGWSVDKDFSFYHLRGAWKIVRRGQPMTFTVNAKSITLLYLKSIESNAGDIKVSIDGGTATTVSSYFANGWGSHITSVCVFDSEQTEEHTIKLSYVGGSFLLAGLMIA